MIKIEYKTKPITMYNKQSQQELARPFPSSREKLDRKGPVMLRMDIKPELGI